MHGVREDLLIEQATSLGIPLYQIRLGETPDMETYDQTMRHHLLKMKSEGITHAIFGDIFLEDLRIYREAKLAEIGLEAIFPLWNKETFSIINEFLQLGYKTIIVCTQKNLLPICGHIITKELIQDLPADVDPCGENGEFHTFVFEGPIFKTDIMFELGDTIYRTYNYANKDDKDVLCSPADGDSTGFWYIDLIKS